MHSYENKTHRQPDTISKVTSMTYGFIEKVVTHNDTQTCINEVNGKGNTNARQYSYFTLNIIGTGYYFVLEFVLLVVLPLFSCSTVI